MRLFILRNPLFIREKVGSNPKKTILFCWLLVLLSSVGFFRFRQERNPMKLWVPSDSRFVKDSEWLMQKFQIGYRPEVVQIIADDVLTPVALKQLLEIEGKVRATKTTTNTTWNDVCFQIPKVDKSLLRLMEGVNFENATVKDPSVTLNAALYCSFVEALKKECFGQSILGLWYFNATVINQLTKVDILDAINTYDKNSIMSRFKNYKELLGGIQHDESGRIVSARSLHNYWMVEVNFTTIDMDEAGNNAGTADWASPEALDWEASFLKTLKEHIVTSSTLNSSTNLSVYYTSSRSFGDISNAAMFQDIGILSIGIFIMVIYVQFVISKFNWLEARVTLGSMGLLTVGMAFVVGCGLCSLFGVPYGPVHTSLPFLLMGLGIDDMFVIMACWDDLTEEQKKLALPIRIGLMLKHAGVSITVTSVTDILAFLIGSSTILPSLESYCIYAACAVLMTFIFAVTFFTACFVLDQERMEKKRNGIIVCYRHEDYRPNDCSQRQISNRVFEYVYSKFIFTHIGKILVVAITALCLGFSIEGVGKLEQRFDPMWLVPDDTYLSEYLAARRAYFPTSGFEAGIYMGSVNYTHELVNIRNVVAQLLDEDEIVFGVVSWLEPFREFVRVNFQADVYEEVLSDEYFSLYLSMFLFSAQNAMYQANFRFEKPLECGAPAPRIIMSCIDFRFRQFDGPEDYLPAMHRVQSIAQNGNFTTGDNFITPWSKAFAAWITDELINAEVVRNLQLALLCVMACTALLIADLQICFWIFICVLLTMINVCGFMQRWGLTIDLVSCIGLELAIGLCVDYATHIGHTFLTVREGTRRERALKTVTNIGSAVLYGGFSTLIGVFMLGQSEAYTFQAFFKIFFLVVTFGLFHGVVLLPVILSWVGPRPYHGMLQQYGEARRSADDLGGENLVLSTM